MKLFFYVILIIAGVMVPFVAPRSEPLKFECRTVSKSCEAKKPCAPTHLPKWLFNIVHPHATVTQTEISSEHAKLLGEDYTCWVSRNGELPPYDQTLANVKVKPEIIKALVFRYDCSQARIFRYDMAGCGQVNHKRYFFNRKTGAVLHQEYYIDAAKLEFPINEVFKIHYGYCDF